MRRRWWPAGAAVIAAVVGLTGCGGANITQGRLDDAVGTTFANLYQRQQALEGKPVHTTPQASATCKRSGRGAPTTGAGDDWVCTLLLQVGGPSSVFTYELSVQSDGCYTADGPPALVGEKTLTTPSGGTRLNPLFEFNGCFDT